MKKMISPVARRLAKVGKSSLGVLSVRVLVVLPGLEASTGLAVLVSLFLVAGDLFIVIL